MSSRPRRTSRPSCNAILLVMLLGLLGTLGSPGVGRAQTPWTVTITPAFDPLPIGYCGAVNIAVEDPAAKGIPRNPEGYRVSMADFDMQVTSSTGVAVVGQYNGPALWNVCACQAGTVGETATITATYPAKALAEKSRVAGAAVRAQRSFTIAAAKGDVQAPGCDALKTTTAAGAPLPELTVPSRAPQGLPSVTSSTGAAERIAGTRGVAKPVPTGLTITATPLVAQITWTNARGARYHALFRSDGGAPSMKQQYPLANVLPDPLIKYRYTVVAYFEDGSSSESAPVDFTSPPMVNPTGFTATKKRDVASATNTLAEVEFRWNEVPGATGYRVDGPGVESTGLLTTGTSAVVSTVPRGPDTWKVTAIYPGKFADYANATTVSAMIRVLPPHTLPWLSKNNGVGGEGTVQVPLLTGCRGIVCGFPPGQLADTNHHDDFWDQGWFLDKDPQGTYGLARWLEVSDADLWRSHPEKEAIYGNAIDLGVGRRTWCTQKMAGPPTSGLVTMCYATAHGVPAGQYGFNDPTTITHPEPRVTDDFILAMVIRKDPTGTTFLALPVYNGILRAVRLDTEGDKFLPHVCLSCHGGKYNDTTRKVDGASYLPVDPSLLAFASEADKSAQQEKIRVINAIIAKSGSAAAVTSYIRGLYGNMVDVPGTIAKADYMPSGWAPQATLYKTVVRPNCAMCHLTGPVFRNFMSWDNFQANGPIIRASVCVNYTMPHAELQFKDFWTKDTGPMYVPGLLAASLGFPSC
jgi:hypothetical protein